LLKQLYFQCWVLNLKVRLSTNTQITWQRSLQSDIKRLSTVLKWPQHFTKPSASLLIKQALTSDSLWCIMISQISGSTLFKVLKPCQKTTLKLILTLNLWQLQTCMSTILSNVFPTDTREKRWFEDPLESSSNTLTRQENSRKSLPSASRQEWYAMSLTIWTESTCLEETWAMHL